LGRKRAAAKPASRRLDLNLAPSALPLARIAFGVAALIVVGVGARLLLVHDPMGGRPVTEISLNSAGSNAIAEIVAPGDVTITAGPEIPADQAGVTIV
jgi:uncharacterized protein